MYKRAVLALPITAVLAASLLFAAPMLQVEAATPLKVTAKAAKDLITRGSIQTIFVKVTDDKGKAVKDATISGIIVYASGSTTKNMSGKTDKNGSYSYEWRIGGNSNPGTFTVEVKASKSGFDTGYASTSFQVMRRN